MTNRYLLYLAFALSLTACQQKGPDAPPAAPTPAPAAPAPTLPSIPYEKVKDLFDKCTSVDYIFYDLPMSMSLEEKASVQYAIRHIASEAAPLNPNCKAMGRVNYLINGNIEASADFYFSEGCKYFVFMVDNKPTYANFMSDEGAKYFENQIKQGIQLRQQGQGQ